RSGQWPTTATATDAVPFASATGAPQPLRAVTAQTAARRVRMRRRTIFPCCWISRCGPPGSHRGYVRVAIDDRAVAGVPSGRDTLVTTRRSSTPAADEVDGDRSVDEPDAVGDPQGHGEERPEDRDSDETALRAPEHRGHRSGFHGFECGFDPSDARPHTGDGSVTNVARARMAAPAMPDPPVRPLPADFLAALEGEEELLVSSRDRRGTGTVRAWFAVAPPGVVLLLTEAHSVKAQRWRRDPWVGLRVPGSGARAEGAARFVAGPEVEGVLFPGLDDVVGGKDELVHGGGPRGEGARARTVPVSPPSASQTAEGSRRGHDAVPPMGDVWCTASEPDPAGIGHGAR